jgi:hypothetical protein
LQVRVLVAGDESLVEVWLDSNLVASRPVRLTAGRPIAAFSIGDGATDRTFTVLYDDVLADRSCNGTCSQDLVTPTPVAIEQPSEANPTSTLEPAPTGSPTPEPTTTPTPEPTATATAEPTTPPEPTSEPEPAEPPQDETTPET